MHFQEIVSRLDSSEMIIGVGVLSFFILFFYIHIHTHICMPMCMFVYGQEEVRRLSLLPTGRGSLFFLM